MKPYNLYPKGTATLYDEYIRNGLRYQKVGSALVDSAETLDGKTVVDLGCGTGIVTQMLAKKVGQ
jgi:ubiquinone/menaquinone biosynthesis C-methylase UbiE